MFSFLQTILFLMVLVSIGDAANILKENVRQKRTLHYFLDGLFSVLTDKHREHNQNARSKSFQQSASSPIATLGKLSSYSAQFNLNKPTNDLEDSLSQESAQIPLPTPDGPTKFTLYPSTTAKNLVKKPSVSSLFDDLAISDNSDSTTISSESSEATTESSNESSNTVAPSEEDKNTEKNGSKAQEKSDESDSGEDLTEKPMMMIIASPLPPARMSELHTTQFFGGPILVERHQDQQHMPSYYGCNQNHGHAVTVNNGDKNAPSYSVPQQLAPHGFMIIPLPVDIRTNVVVPFPKIGERSKSKVKVQPNNENYGLSNLHVPVVHLSQPQIQIVG